jgi:hypothetical protein
MWRHKSRIQVGIVDLNVPLAEHECGCVDCAEEVDEGGADR